MHERQLQDRIDRIYNASSCKESEFRAVIRSQLIDAYSEAEIDRNEKIEKYLDDNGYYTRRCKSFIKVEYKYGKYKSYTRVIRTLSAAKTFIIEDNLQKNTKVEQK